MMMMMMMTFSIFFRYFCEKELGDTKQEIKNTEDKLIKLAPFTPDRNKSLSWPLGKVNILAREMIITRATRTVLIIN